MDPRSAPDGLAGTYSETVRLWEEHRYQVCYLGGTPTVKVCSDNVPALRPASRFSQSLRLTAIS